RVRAWAPSSVREALFRTTYRGVITWNQSRKRDAWGQQRQVDRPASEWLQQPAPHLRVVSDAEWQAAHARLAAARTVYLRGTEGRRFGRSAVGTASPYLLTSFAECAICGSTMKVLTRSHGRRRGRFYGCAGYHDRGRSVCANGRVLPMDDANQIVLEAVLDDLLSADIITAAVDQALQSIVAGSDDDKSATARMERQIEQLDAERRRLVDAIVVAGDLASLVPALRDREAAIARLHGEYSRLQALPAAIDPVKVRAQLLALAADWKQLLVGEPDHARPLLSSLLVGRLKFKPQERPHAWELSGRGTIAGLIARVFDLTFPLGMASPTGFEPVF
ncbi:MAG TPA: recombinase zinc beta ribbon domain-containing protein, partial [Vicinamibacterales bacterium]|nr:recombinase zinc beta ribbon domain-containing protein [Vicinamibacterales bacterium]